MTDLGTLGGHNSIAKGIAEFGRSVVGESELAGTTSVRTPSCTKMA